MDGHDAGTVVACVGSIGVGSAVVIVGDGGASAFWRCFFCFIGDFVADGFFLSVGVCSDEGDCGCAVGEGGSFEYAFVFVWLLVGVLRGFVGFG